MESNRLQIRIGPDRIHFLRFILEGYDGLAQLTTVNAKLGLVELRYFPGEKETVLQLVDNLALVIHQENVLS